MAFAFTLLLCAVPSLLVETLFFEGHHSQLYQAEVRCVTTVAVHLCW